MWGTCGGRGPMSRKCPGDRAPAALGNGERPGVDRAGIDHTPIMWNVQCNQWPMSFWVPPGRVDGTSADRGNSIRNRRLRSVIIISHRTLPSVSRFPEKSAVLRGPAAGKCCGNTSTRLFLGPSQPPPVTSRSSPAPSSLTPAPSEPPGTPCSTGL